MFKVRKRRAHPQASFDLCSSSVDTDARETPLKRAHASPAAPPALPALPALPDTSEASSSPLTAAAAAQQRSRESSLARSGSSTAASAPAAAPAPPEAVVNTVAVCVPPLSCAFFCLLFFAWVCKGNGCVCVCVCLQLAAVEDMRVSLEMLVGLRTEADSLHERALAAADRRDEAAQALIKRLALQVTRLEAQVRELHERERMFEDALFSQAKDAPDSDSSSDSSEDENEEASESESESEQSSEQSSDNSSGSSSEEEETEEEKEEEKEKEEKKKEEEGRETDVGTAAQTGAPRTPGSVKKSPALAHVPLQSAPAPERTSIALPPQSPLTAPRAHSPTGSADTGADTGAGPGSAAAVRVAQLERIVKFYEELTGVTVQPGPDPAGELQSPQFACTAVDCSAQRAVQFQLLFGERSVEYTPTRIDVPADLALSEEVTEAIEFSSTLTPIFLVKLIDELNSTVVPG